MEHEYSKTSFIAEVRFVKNTTLQQKNVESNVNFYSNQLKFPEVRPLIFRLQPVTNNVKPSPGNVNRRRGH